MTATVLIVEGPTLAELDPSGSIESFLHHTDRDGQRWPITTRNSVTAVEVHTFNAKTRAFLVVAEAGVCVLRTDTTSALADNVAADGSGGDIKISADGTGTPLTQYAGGVNQNHSFLGLIEAS
jgi:hypothetical protein